METKVLTTVTISDFLEVLLTFNLDWVLREAFLRAAAGSRREAIKKGALLILDISATPVDGSIVMCHLDEQMRMLRLRLHPRPRLEELDRPEITYPMTSSMINR
ncbi:hypothetical protein PU683_13585 [Kosakonia cowanii]|uniref:hypothetical protein n=1 Tax=Kosakonia cowanii TaxID=208223 RepID=UPI0023F88DA0|nr:hypothetical protein [Kosakonia cowanii]MDF7760549.1 hypothetical protein [Kosakonia cowanii]